MNGIYARYNEQKNCIDVTVYEAGYILRLDCGKWEDGIKATMNSQGRLDALAIDDPMEYVRLALDEEMNFPWGISNGKCQFMGNFHGEYKIFGF